MARINTKKSAIFIKSGATLPVGADGFLEVTEELSVNPTVKVEEFKRVNGLLGSNDSYADTCDTTISLSLTHNMRTSNKAGDALDTVPEYGEILKLGGFTETVGVDSVVYKNSQTPAKGSVCVYIDGNKHSSTNGAVADVKMDFTVGMPAKITATLSAFLDNEGVATTATNPTVTLSTEDLMVVGCTDIISTDGTAIKADKVGIEVNPQVDKFYGMGIKEYAISDYNIKITADFYPENANYNDAITKINAGTVEALLIKLNTGTAGALVDGKSVLVTATLGKVTSFTDSNDKSNLKRSVTWMLQGNSAGECISIAHGNHS